MPFALARNIIVCCICLLSCFKIAQACYARLIADHTSMLTHKHGPTLSSPLSRTTLTLNEIALRQRLAGIQQRNIKNTALGVLKKRPLNGKIFSQIAHFDALDQDRLPAKYLLEIAMGRNIHNLYAVRHLTYSSLLENDALGAFQLLDTLDKTKTNTNPYRELMANISKTDIGWDALDHYLPLHPTWGDNVLRRRIKTMSDVESSRLKKSLHLYFGATILTPDSKDNFKQLQRDYINQLIKLGQFTQARTYWEMAHTDSSIFQSTFIHDPNFKASKAPPPFNWKYDQGINGHSAFDAGLGLFVSFTGRKYRSFASQTLHLSPKNQYRLIIEADWKHTKNQGYFGWNIKCVPQQQSLASIKMLEPPKNTNAPMVLQTDFFVPTEHCDFQTIRLYAQSGQYVKNITASIGSVTIVELNNPTPPPLIPVQQEKRKQ